MTAINKYKKNEEERYFCLQAPLPTDQQKRVRTYYSEAIISDMYINHSLNEGELYLSLRAPARRQPRSLF